MRLVILALLVAVSACAHVGPQAASSSASIDLGAYQRARPETVSRRFSQTIAGRYSEGAALRRIEADLAANRFACRSLADRRGDPPSRVCRRSVRQGECVHTWQVMLYTEGRAQRLTRTRGGYDRACGSDQLLGG